MMCPLTTATRRAAARCLRPLVRRAARAYIAGEHLSEAVKQRALLAERGLATTLGFWDGASDQPRGVADEYLKAVAALAGSQDYLSIKLPALRFSSELLDEVAAAARQAGVRLHCDSHGPEDADITRERIEQLQSLGASVSLTLPGRWNRSLEDAEWAVARGIGVRVVKGQWADPADPTRDQRAGFLELVERLEGTGVHVAIASHDVPLADDCLRRLQSARTSCSLELLFGLPMRGSLASAERLGVPVRVYVPYGAAYLPYALAKVRQNPWMAWWLVKDMLVGR